MSEEKSGRKPGEGNQRDNSNKQGQSDTNRDSKVQANQADPEVQQVIFTKEEREASEEIETNINNDNS